jgi:hypothetical protein
MAGRSKRSIELAGAMFATFNRSMIISLSTRIKVGASLLSPIISRPARYC